MACAGARRRPPTELHAEGLRWAGHGRARLGSCGPEVQDVDAGLRAPRLSRELRALKAFNADITDWRKLDPSEIAASCSSSMADSTGRSLLATAIFTGTAQACLKGSYWAPSYSCPGAMEVDCRHLSRPISCLYASDRMPRLDALQVRNTTPSITCMPRWSVLDACARVHSSASNARVALLRFTGFRDSRNASIRYGHLREDQLFLRSTYFKAFESMESDINCAVGDALDEGGLVYTSGVGILRGSVEEGALWFREPPKVDVIWVALPARPHLAEQEQYADDRDRNLVSRTLGRAFACAAAHGADAVVLAPVGCGTHGCLHPSLDVADIIHKTAKQYERYIPQVCVVSDHPGHLETGWWEDFAAAVQGGRPHPEARQPVPPIALPPYLVTKKDTGKLLEKTRLLTGRLRATPRTTPRSDRMWSTLP
mmetsp:Transcript_97090/g.257988  ORF Transcript_97090/g.257988 Transcript_97090/m.257988 type:complete len:426 (-) Transcript_97090:55-1332(-)